MKARLHHSPPLVPNAHQLNHQIAPLVSAQSPLSGHVDCTRTGARVSPAGNLSSRNVGVCCSSLGLRRLSRRVSAPYGGCGCSIPTRVLPLPPSPPTAHAPRPQGRLLSRWRKDVCYVHERHTPRSGRITVLGRSKGGGQQAKAGKMRTRAYFLNGQWPKKGRGTANGALTGRLERQPPLPVSRRTTATLRAGQNRASSRKCSSFSVPSGPCWSFLVLAIQPSSGLMFKKQPSGVD